MKSLKTFPAQLSELEHIVKFIETTSLQLSKSMELAIEEALVNIFSYAYPEKKGVVEISVDCNTHTLDITIIDRGIPYNPTSYFKEYKTDPSQIGGVGVHLINQIAKEIHYVRSDGKNILTLKFSI